MLRDSNHSKSASLDNNHKPRFSRNRALVSAIISMGHALGLDVTAEGVETESELLYLREQHCDRAQGWYFGHPVPSDDLSALFEAQDQRRLASL